MAAAAASRRGKLAATAEAAVGDPHSESPAARRSRHGHAARAEAAAAGMWIMAAAAAHGWRRRLSRHVPLWNVRPAVVGRFEVRGRLVETLLLLLLVVPVARMVRSRQRELFRHGEPG